MKALPLLIAIGGLSLVVKVGGIWQSIDAISTVLAQETTTDNFDSGEPLADTPMPEKLAVVDTGIVEEDTPDDDLPLLRAEGLEIDPFSMTDEELEILQSLSRRREMLVERERDLDKRDVLLQATEKRLDEKMAELRELQATIEDLVRENDTKTEEQMSSLVKIYEAMKPKEAARIFNNLDMVVLLDVIERMKERKTAPILARMSPDRANAVTLELARRRILPFPKE